MAKPSQVRNSELRGLIEEARRAYLDDDARRSIEQSVAAFKGLLRLRPDFLTTGPFAGNNRRVWPQLGVSLRLQDPTAPEVTYEREQYSTPDAITFYEYVTDCIVASEI